MSKMIWLFKTTLFASALVLGAISTTVDVTPTEASASVIRGTFIKCENPCEIRLEDGECKVDIVCLMRRLLPKSVAAEESLSDLHKKLEKEGSEGPKHEDKCKGTCLFADQKNNCRMDLICVLGRDVEGTLRFLVESDVDPEIAILLALSGKSGGSGCPKDGRAFSAVKVCDLCEFRNAEGNCVRDVNCEIGEDGQPIYKGTTDERVVVTPLKKCPGKCEFRDSKTGKCVVDYDCANGIA